MMQRYDIAVIGADSPLGTVVLELLSERRFPAGEISALALEPDDEATVDFMGQTLLVDTVEGFDFGSVQLAFLAGDDPRLAGAAERAADAGCVVVDAAGVDWGDLPVPRVIAELNPGDLAEFNECGIVANPDRLLVALGLALAPLQRAVGLHRISLTAVVPASDRGRAAMADLARETAALLNARQFQRADYPQQIAFNVLGQCDPVDSSGSTERERRIVEELGPVIGTADLPVSASLLHAGVFHGYAVQVEVDLAVDSDMATVRAALDSAPGVEVVDSAEAADCPSPVSNSAGVDTVRIGRLRPGGSPRCVQMFLVADNLRRCGALNALQLAEILARDYL